MNCFAISFANSPGCRTIASTFAKPWPTWTDAAVWTGATPRDNDRIREAVEIADGLVAQYPNVPLYAAAQAQSNDLLGFSLFAGRDLPGAESAHRKAAKLQAELVKQYPEVTAYKFWLSLMMLVGKFLQSVTI